MERLIRELPAIAVADARLIGANLAETVSARHTCVLVSDAGGPVFLLGHLFGWFVFLTTARFPDVAFRVARNAKRVLAEMPRMVGLVPTHDARRLKFIDRLGYRIPSGPGVSLFMVGPW